MTPAKDAKQSRNTKESTALVIQTFTVNRVKYTYNTELGATNFRERWSRQELQAQQTAVTVLWRQELQAQQTAVTVLWRQKLQAQQTAVTILSFQELQAQPTAVTILWRQELQAQQTAVTIVSRQT